VRRSVVSPLGFEPRTQGLKVPRSATELRAHVGATIAAGEMVARDAAVRLSFATMHRRIFSAESKKKLRRPCREARALGL
jgi:hypothetical protein